MIILTGQVVVSGKTDQLKKFMDLLKENKIKKVLNDQSAIISLPFNE